MRSNPFHIVFVLDESGSMSGPPFEELRNAYNEFIQLRKNRKNGDFLSTVLFNGNARTIVKYQEIDKVVPLTLTNYGGNTAFRPALCKANECLSACSNASTQPIIIFMTDGCCADLSAAIQEVRRIDAAFQNKSLQVHFVAFGSADMNNLDKLKENVTAGYVSRANIGELEMTFKKIEESLCIAEFSSKEH